jgi:GTPase SAR1 family protein
MVLYGQIIIGAPGAGKTTYCDGMQQYLKLLGRECHVVNLDPANEVPPSTSDDGDDGDGAAATAVPRGEGRGNSQLPYETVLDVCEDVISLDSVMSELNLGPNGG